MDFSYKSNYLIVKSEAIKKIHCVSFGKEMPFYPDREEEERGGGGVTRGLFKVK